MVTKAMDVVDKTTMYLGYTDAELRAMVANIISTMKGGKAEFARRSGIKEQTIKDWFRRANRNYKISFQDGVRILKMSQSSDVITKSLLRTAMDIVPYLTPLKCPNCQVALIRIPESVATNCIGCIECGAAGNYKEVVEYKGGIKDGVLTKKELSRIREKLGFPE